MAEVKPIISVRGLKVQRGGRIVLDGINLDIHPGDFVGVVGPNGSGKSTLLLTIIGELEPLEGSITVFGGAPGSAVTRGRIAWVSQAAANLPSNLRISVRELVELGTVTGSNMLRFRDPQRSIRIDEAIRMVGLGDVENRDVGRLSGGQRQRAVVARGLASNADVLILDEPLVGVDRESRNDFLLFLENLCRKEGKTLIMVTHDHTAIGKCTHCAVCIDGNVQLENDAISTSNPLSFSGIHSIRPNVLGEFKLAIQTKEEE